MASSIGRVIPLQVREEECRMKLLLCDWVQELCTIHTSDSMSFLPQIGRLTEEHLATHNNKSGLVS